MTTLSVVIPAWNEEDGIQSVMDRVLSIRAALPSVGIDQLELIVVDDGSTDHTADIVEATPGARLVTHAKNAGYGAALKTGFAMAEGEWIGFLDADGTYPPEHFPALCKAAIDQDADIVIGSRMSGAQSEMPLVRRVGNFVFANLVSLVSAQRITDSASGMRVFKKSVLEQLYPLPNGLNLTPVMSTRALHEQLKMIEVPIPYSERVGRSKLSVLRDGARFAHSIIWTALNYNPVRPLGLIGVAASALAALIGLTLVVVRLSGQTSVSPVGAFILFSALVLGVSGISVFGLGASFNYYVSLFHNRPIRQGLFGRPLFKRGLERYFGLAGLVVLSAGIIISIVALVLGIRGWPVSRLWIYYLASASAASIGIQLIVAWIQMQVLEALKERAELIAEDMRPKIKPEPQATAGVGIAAVTPRTAH